VNAAQRDLQATFDNVWFNGLDMVDGGPPNTTNPYNCSLPTSCNELFGYPVPDGSFAINTQIPVLPGSGATPAAPWLALIVCMGAAVGVAR